MSTVLVTITADETEAWATRPGNVWPCSTVRGKSLAVELVDGDLVDIQMDSGSIDDIDGHELHACVDDHLMKARMNIDNGPGLYEIVIMAESVYSDLADKARVKMDQTTTQVDEAYYSQQVSHFKELAERARTALGKAGPIQKAIADVLVCCRVAWSRNANHRMLTFDQLVIMKEALEVYDKKGVTE